jgi:hypothetical protein
MQRRCLRTVLARGCDVATGYHALVSGLCALTSSAGINITLFRPLALLRFSNGS